MKADTHKTEMSLEQLGQVTGGTAFLPLIASKVAAAAKKPTGPSGGGMNDPAQMFQQILQQLTQPQ